MMYLMLLDSKAGLILQRSARVLLENHQLHHFTIIFSFGHHICNAWLVGAAAGFKTKVLSFIFKFP